MSDIMKMGKNPNFLGSWDIEDQPNREIILTIEKIVDDEIKRVVAKKEPSELAAAWSRFDPMYSSDLQLQLL